MADVVVRRWEARAPMAAIGAWLGQVHGRVIPKYQAAEGFRWVKVLMSRDGDPRSVIVLTAWDDIDAVKRFAGADPNTAVMPDWVAKLMPDHDNFATHYDEVLAEADR